MVRRSKRKLVDVKETDCKLDDVEVVNDNDQIGLDKEEVKEVDNDQNGVDTEDVKDVECSPDIETVGEKIVLTIQEIDVDVPVDVKDQTLLTLKVIDEEGTTYDLIVDQDCYTTVDFHKDQVVKVERYIVVSENSIRIDTDFSIVTVLKSLNKDVPDTDFTLMKIRHLKTDQELIERYDKVVKKGLIPSITMTCVVGKVMATESVHVRGDIAHVQKIVVFDQTGQCQVRGWIKDWIGKECEGKVVRFTGLNFGYKKTLASLKAEQELYGLELCFNKKSSVEVQESEVKLNRFIVGKTMGEWMNIIPVLK